MMDKLPLLDGVDTQELLLILSEHVKGQKVKAYSIGGPVFTEPAN